MSSEYSLLVVDPSEAIRKVVALAAGKLVAKTKAVGTAQGAAKALEAGFDLVLTETELPDGNGQQVLEAALTASDTSVVVIMTAEDDVSQAMDLIRHGAFSVLTKPMSRKLIVTTLQRALEQLRILQENRAAKELEKRYASELEEQVAGQTSIIESLIGFSNDLNSLTTTEEAVSLVKTILRKTLRSQRVSIVLQTPETGQFAVVESHGLKRKTSTKVIELSESRVLEKVAGDNELTYVDGRRKWAMPGEKDWTSPYICVPLLGDDGGRKVMFGTINITDRDEGTAFSDQELKIVRSVADAASVACANLRNKQQLEKSYFDTVGALAMALEAKDPYTHGHSQRVTSMCMIVADVLSYSNEDMDQIMFAGMLHDVGKIGVPESILLKEERLSRDEYDRIREHPVVGERMVSHISFLKQSAGIIRHHHERWDGKGYPDQLRGEAIELSARIMAVADSYDAMTTDRSYRKQLNPHQVRDELWKGKGTQFDPEVLDIFLQHVAQSKNIPTIM